MSKHTPGPWIVEEAGHYGSPRLLYEIMNKRTVAHALEEGPFNARLIAAAPEMLEGLEATVRQMEYQISAGFSSADSGMGSLVNILKKTISKAKLGG